MKIKKNDLLKLVDKESKEHEELHKLLDKRWIPKKK